jgi:DNA-binding MurR/RpiR family transcriptional regulator
MQNSVKDRIVKLREEIAQISEANRVYLHGGKRKIADAAADHERRLQRLQEILDQLLLLTDWKKT